MQRLTGLWEEGFIGRLRTTVALIGALSSATLAQQSPQPVPVPPPADGITMAMMPITADQLAACRQQASDQLAKEQETLGEREGKQDANKMKQGGITAVAGGVTTAIGRKGWWGGNHSGDATAQATANTQRTERNSDNVASTMATRQVTGNKAYDDCIDGVKGPSMCISEARENCPHQARWFPPRDRPQPLWLRLPAMIPIRP